MYVYMYICVYIYIYIYMCIYIYIGANYCTPEVNTSESIVDVQLRFPMDVQ